MEVFHPSPAADLFAAPILHFSLSYSLTCMNANIVSPFLGSAESIMPTNSPVLLNPGNTPVVSYIAVDVLLRQSIREETFIFRNTLSSQFIQAF